MQQITENWILFSMKNLPTHKVWTLPDLFSEIQEKSIL